MLNSLISWLKGRDSEEIDRLSILPTPAETADEAASDLPPADADNFDWVHPPADRHDPAAWDAYWQDQFDHLGGLAFIDLFVDDREFVAALRERSGESVLCLGNGVSREPLALAAAGFHVTVLDVSPLANDTLAKISRQIEPGDDDMFKQYIDAGDQRGGGSVTYVTGDFTDASICPGPFDLIIERRTLQLFREELPFAVDRIAGRLAPDGILFSQSHLGGWRPGDERAHPAEKLLEQKVAVEPIYERTVQHGQIAWLMVTSG